MLPKLLANYLDATGKSRRSLARELGVSNQTVGVWVDGGPVGDDVQLVALLAAIEAPPHARLAVWSARWGVRLDEVHTVVGLEA